MRIKGKFFEVKIILCHATVSIPLVCQRFDHTYEPERLRKFEKKNMNMFLPY